MFCVFLSNIWPEKKIKPIKYGYNSSGKFKKKKKGFSLLFIIIVFNFPFSLPFLLSNVVFEPKLSATLLYCVLIDWPLWRIPSKGATQNLKYTEQRPIFLDLVENNLALVFLDWVYTDLGLQIVTDIVPDLNISIIAYRNLIQMADRLPGSENSQARNLNYFYTSMIRKTPIPWYRQPWVTTRLGLDWSWTKDSDWLCTGYFRLVTCSTNDPYWLTVQCP